MISRVSARTTLVVAMALGVVTFAPPAVAGDVPAFTLNWTTNDGSVVYDWNHFGTLYGLGMHQVKGSNQDWIGWRYQGNVVELGWELKWNCVFNHETGGAGAFVTANIVVTNNDAGIQKFSLLMTLPTGPLGSLLERGSVVGTVTDLTQDDATVSAPADGQIYAPMIDGVPEAAGFLMIDPFSQSAGGSLASSPVGPAAFGLPVPIATSVESSIGIMLNFNLTPGDTASFTSIFEVFIPAPSGLPVLAAIGFLGGRRRR